MPRAAATILVSLALIFFISCADIPPTYTRTELANVVTKICKDEFNLTVRTWDEGDTLWVYFPYNNLASVGQLDKNSSNNLRRVIRTVGRVTFSVDKRPQFYCLVASDIKNGIDDYFAAYGDDQFLFEMGALPFYEFIEREATMRIYNPKAIGDTEGTHLARHNITMGEFISYVIQQSLEKKFLSDEFKNKFKINELKVDYTDTSLRIIVDIKPLEYNSKLPEPLDEARKTARHFLEI
ncbi:MAG: hypothetical protein ABH865_05065, partial [Candidatus Omnitrophota bacterium]